MVKDHICICNLSFFASVLLCSFCYDCFQSGPQHNVSVEKKRQMAPNFCLNVPDSAYGTTCFQDKLVDQINAILSDAHANTKSTSLIFQSAY